MNSRHIAIMKIIESKAGIAFDLLCILSLLFGLASRFWFVRFAMANILTEFDRRAVNSARHISSSY